MYSSEKEFVEFIKTVDISQNEKKG